MTASRRRDRYAARCVNLVLVVTRIAVLGARSAPRDTGNQPRALPGYQGQSPWLGGMCAAAALVGAIAVQALSSVQTMGSGERTRRITPPPDHSPLDQINRANVGKLKVAWRRSQTPPDIPLSSCASPEQQFPLDSHHGGWRALRLERPWPRRGVRSSNGRDDLVQKPGDDPLRGSASLRGIGVLDRREGASRPLLSQPVSLRARREDWATVVTRPSALAGASTSRPDSTRAPAAGAGVPHRSSSATSP